MCVCVCVCVRGGVRGGGISSVDDKLWPGGPRMGFLPITKHIFNLNDKLLM